MIKIVFLLITINFLSLINCTPIIISKESDIVSDTIIKNEIEDEVLDMLKPAPSNTQLQHDETGQCTFVHAEEGVYSYVSPGDINEICGLYIIAEPTQFVTIEFEVFDVSCTKRGLVSVIDGWELNGQFFPGIEDHAIPRKERYHEYCGIVKPRKPFRMSQNVGLIEFRIPIKGEGFRVKVTFTNNHKPCNTVLQTPQGVYTLRNYGRRINCTISIIFPESFRILAASVASESRVGSMTPSRNLYVETGIIRKCKKRGSSDYVEIRGGDGLDPGLMEVAEDFCGVDSLPSKKKIDIACGNAAVRLVSSGKYDNSLTVAFDLLLDFTSPSLSCPTFIDSL